MKTDPVNNPKHYQHPSGIEPIDLIVHESFCCGNAIKYILRHQKKGKPVEDLKKAIWYLNKQLEIYKTKK